MAGYAKGLINISCPARGGLKSGGFNCRKLQAKRWMCSKLFTLSLVLQWCLSFREVSHCRGLMKQWRTYPDHYDPIRSSFVEKPDFWKPLSRLASNCCCRNWFFSMVLHISSAALKAVSPELLKQGALHISEVDLLLEDIHSSQYSLCQASSSYLHPSPSCQLYPSSPTEVTRLMSPPAWSLLLPPPPAVCANSSSEITHRVLSVLIIPASVCTFESCESLRQSQFSAICGETWLSVWEDFCLFEAQRWSGRPISGPYVNIF